MMASVGESRLRALGVACLVSVLGLYVLDWCRGVRVSSQG